LKLTTMVPPGALTEEGAKFALTPLGRPVALKDTLPVSPPTKVTVMVSVGFVFGARVMAVGESEIVKSGLATTVKVIVVVATVAPLVPVMVTVAGPTVAVPDAVKVSVLPVDPVTEAGLKLAVTPVGRPLAVKVTAPVKPLNVETVTLLDALAPCRTDTLVAATEKPGLGLDEIGGKAFCTSCKNSVIQNAPAGGEFGIELTSWLLPSALACAGSQFSSPPPAGWRGFVSPSG
jgi:hypothetical protein